LGLGLKWWHLSIRHQSNKHTATAYSLSCASRPMRVAEDDAIQESTLCPARGYARRFQPPRAFPSWTMQNQTHSRNGALTSRRCRNAESSRNSPLTLTMQDSCLNFRRSLQGETFSMSIEGLQAPGTLCHIRLSTICVRRNIPHCRSPRCGGRRRALLNAAIYTCT
jgi:hypothetical protein